MFVYEMNLEEAEKTVRAMADERYVKPNVIVAEYLKYRDAKTNACKHFWPNQNSACFKMVSILDQLES